MNLRALLLTGLTLSAFHATTASAREVCGTEGSGLNFRSGPSMHSRVRTTIPEGTAFDSVQATSANGQWLKVGVNGQTGWVFRNFTCGEARTAAAANNNAAPAPDAGTGAIAKFRNPIAGSCVRSDFGPRRRPKPGASAYHQGCDLNGSCGTPVRSTAPGRVIFAGRRGGYGNAIIIQHADGTQSLYGHLSRINVRRGQQPSADTVIGNVGTTGVSTGCHLHFGILKNGRYVDPQRYIGQARCPTTGVTTGSRWFRP